MIWRAGFRGSGGWTCLALLLAVAASAVGTPSLAADRIPIPGGDAIARLLEEKPISRETWPFWRRRYLDWYCDRSGATKSFDERLAEFVGRQAEPEDRSLPAWLKDDPIAWRLFGTCHMQADTPSVLAVKALTAYLTQYVHAIHQI